MSRIDELVERFCPDGAEYKTLGEVGTFTRGNGIQKKDFVDEGIGCIHYGQIYTSYGLFADKTISFISPDFARGKRMAKQGDLIIATTSENEKDVCKAVSWLGNEEIAVSNDAYIFSHSLNPKYMAYFFQSSLFQTQKRSCITGTKVLRVSGDSMAKFKAPVPPMEIQEEIVRILDSFSELEAELEAELEKREKQYTYYCDYLLSHSNLEKMAKGEVNKVALGSLGSFYSGLAGKTKTDFSNGNAPYIPYTNIYNNIAVNLANLPSVNVSESEHQHEVRRGDVLVTGSSETPDDCGMTSVVLREPIEKTYLNSFCFGWRPNTACMQNLEPGFLKYVLRSYEARKQIVRTANGVTRFNVSKKSFASVKIPIPPIAVQKYVTDILDKFDTLANDLSSGIPAEIEARRKQYEYYRDKLLTFKEKPGD